MRWLFKWIFRLVLLLVVLIVAFVWSKDAVLKALLERRISARTGMDVKIGKFSAPIFSAVVDIENLKLYNAPEFGGTLFLDAPEIHIRYDRVALCYRELHIELLRLNVAELNIVKNDTGSTNFATLRWETPTRNSAKRGEFQFTGVDVLNLSVTKATFINLKHPEDNREFRPNFQNHITKDVKSEDKVRDILFEIWLRSGGGIPTYHGTNTNLKVRSKSLL